MTDNRKRMGRPKVPGKALTESVRLYPEDSARLARLAERLGMSRSAVVRAALEALESSGA